MLDGPLHIGWRVAVNDGCAVAFTPTMDGWVDVKAELELAVPLLDRVGISVLVTRAVELAVNVEESRLGLKG
jgi:hypothetical protein